jgi:HrpA-like RNA helicase
MWLVRIGWENQISSRRRFAPSRVQPRTEGYTHDARVWALCFVQGPFSVAPSSDSQQSKYWASLGRWRTRRTAGEQLARFPLEPQAACTLVAATRMGCGEEMLVVLAMLSAENIFYLPREKKVGHLQVQAKRTHIPNQTNSLWDGPDPYTPNRALHGEANTDQRESRPLSPTQLGRQFFSR